MNDILTEKAINTLRFLAVDGVQKANSGHPGLPLGTAAIAYTIWTKHLNIDPKNPNWIDRDRFVLSGGHGSMLLYSLLHLTGFNVSIDDLKQFRQWGSITPGHPEYGLTPGVDTTTGPLGQGFANGVGMAIAEFHLAAEFNSDNNKIIDHYVYGIVTDGDLMEGVSSEAASLAGHLQLGKLIYCYDDNRITIDGSTDLSFTEDRGKRFESYGWQVLHITDGNDVLQIDTAIRAAKKDPRPSLIICPTHIGFGMPTRQDTAKAHGEPPGDEELNGAKAKLGWPIEPRFLVPEDTLAIYRNAGIKGHDKAEKWNELLNEYQKQFPEKGKDFLRRLTKALPENWEGVLPIFDVDPKGMATRVASGQALNAIADIVPELVGGSADLTPSNNTKIKNSTDYSSTDHLGRYFHFGVREHAMGAIVNGMAYHGGLIPFGATFLVFTDYMRGAIRISALSHLHAIWVMTHDSVGLGEDGPTHQPIEHLASLRAIPGLTVIRPCDANETVEAWKFAIEHKEGPTLLALSRQAVPTLDRKSLNPAEGLKNGAYILADLGKKPIDLILMATGSEVYLALEAAKNIASDGYGVRVVSFPSWELFKKAGKAYQQSVLPKDVKKRIAIELGVSQGWEKWVGDEGDILAIDHYGASAPYQKILEEFGFTVEKIVERSIKILKAEKK